VGEECLEGLRELPAHEEISWPVFVSEPVDKFFFSELRLGAAVAAIPLIGVLAFRYPQLPTLIWSLFGITLVICFPSLRFLRRARAQIVIASHALRFFDGRKWMEYPWPQITKLQFNRENRWFEVVGTDSFGVRALLVVRYHGDNILGLRHIASGLIPVPVPVEVSEMPKIL
jgi:hypothetical protein